MHPEFFTPEQLAKATELAGDLTLSYATPQERLLDNLESATRAYMQAVEANMPDAVCDPLWDALKQAKLAWKRHYGNMPERHGGVWF